MAATVLPPILARFMKRWPNVAVSLHDDFVGPTVERVASGEVDLALVPYEGDSRELDFVRCCATTSTFWCRASIRWRSARRRIFAEIAGYPLLSMPREAAVWETVARAFEAEHMPFRPAFQAQNLFTLLGLVEAGVGLTLLPRIILLRVNLNVVTTVRIAGRGLHRTIDLLTQRGRILSPAAMAFIRVVRVALPPLDEAPAPAEPRPAMLRAAAGAGGLIGCGNRSIARSGLIRDRSILLDRPAPRRAHPSRFPGQVPQ